MPFLKEIKRRKVFQVAAVYAVVAWLVIQIIDVVNEPLSLPDWLDTIVIVLLAVGFPIAVVLAWAYERTPDGVILDRGPASEPTAEFEVTSPNRGLGLTAYAVIAGSLVIALVIGILIGRETLQLPELTDTTRTPIQLTANPLEDAVVSAAISPDGRYLAYADSLGLSLRLVESGETHPLALPDGFQIREIDWFPDGAQLLLSATVSDVTSLWKLAIVGGQPRKIRNRAFRAAVSPDGTQIAYLSTTFPTSEIYLMGAEGEDASKLVDAGDNSLVWELAWSSNSKWLAYGRSLTAPDGRGVHIEIIDVSDKTSKLIIENDRLFQNWRGSLPFYWTPDDRLIYALRDLPPNGARSNLWQIAIDSESGELLGAPSQITRVTSLNFRDLSMTADGSRLVFLLENNQADVYVGDLFDGNSVLRNTRRLTFDERGDYPYGWTADSREVFFVSERGVRDGVFRQNIQESFARSVSNSTTGDQSGGELSPDGKWILFWEERPDDRVALVRVPVGGGPPESVSGVSVGDFHCPSSVEVSSDCVLGVRGDGNQFVFYALNPVYGLGRELVSIEVKSFFANWDLSPDGERIALVHNDGRLRIITIEDGGEREIKWDDWAIGEFVTWSPDGSGVIVDGLQHGTQRLKKDLLNVSLETDEVHLLRREPNQWHVHPSISPDGLRVAFGLMVFSGNAWMIEEP